MTAKGRAPRVFHKSHAGSVEVLIYKEKSAFDFSKCARTIVYYTVIQPKPPDVGAIKYCDAEWPGSPRKWWRNTHEFVKPRQREFYIP